ncbi:hypothetical protein ROLI_026660 [Roseobacter fucihabitans]|uniref:Uncharacterized protein n=1 Tax=Roseobacter fucihabitans TaxID=1537242 RepID=A0ABZ2BW55_9RHOB|nr:hypothetical protein [Roseobacter litoralis]MBC6967373.1 hypothetical protein [Roseobacter litoralis]
MTDEQEKTTTKVHYICQTYTEKKTGRGAQVSLQIDKQLQYATASQAQERAEREVRSDSCAGADAYMVTEDPSSGEVGEPTFIVRLGCVPEAD